MVEGNDLLRRRGESAARGAAPSTRIGASEGSSGASRGRRDASRGPGTSKGTTAALQKPSPSAPEDELQRGDLQRLRQCAGGERPPVAPALRGGPRPRASPLAWGKGGLALFSVLVHIRSPGQGAPFARSPLR